MLDTIYAAETPEGIELHLPVAGPVSRALAWAIDFLIRVFLYIVLATILVNAGRAGLGILMILTFAMEWFYPVIFEVKRNGQTPGKSALGLKVIHDDGTPVSWGASMIRNLLRVADFLPLFYGFGLLSVMFSKQFKRLGDHAAGTLVVYAEKPGRPVEPTAVQAFRPPYPLRLEEQQALLAFDEQSTRLAQERAEELAGLTGPLVEGQARPVEALQGMAHWLSGDRGRSPVK
jgi:uncharacterized RDD family membrane protein YckC